MNCLLCKQNSKVDESYKKEHFIDMWKPFYDVKSIFKEDIIYKYKCESCDLVFFDPKYSGTNEFYSELGKLDWYYNHPGKTEFEYCQKFIKEGDFVLDIGCGIGVLKDKLPHSVDYTGVELSEFAKSVAESKGLKVYNETIQNFSKESKEKYDCVVSFQVLEHLNELETFISAAKDCVKPGGFFIVAVPNNEAFIKNVPNNKFNLPPHHMIHWTKNQLIKLGEIFEYKIEDIHFEKIQDIHIQEARVSAIFALISKFKRKKVKLVDYSEWQFITTRRIHTFLKYFPTIIIDILLKHKYKYGQSIMAVYRK